MKKTRSIALASLCAAACLSALATATPAAAVQDKDKKPPIAPELMEALRGESDPRQEMIELFRKVEGTLEEIDKLLYDAGAGERSAKGAARDSGLAELLQRSKAKSTEVVSGIDRILEIAKQQGGSCSSGMSGGQPQNSSGGQKQGQPQQGSGGERQQRENTPEQPGGQQPSPEQHGQQPENQGQEPRDSGDPRGDKESSRTPENTVGGPPPGLETGRVAPGSDAERWGELPEQYRELFRTEGGGDLPPQYRDWIDAYHRRLNRRR